MATTLSTLVQVHDNSPQLPTEAISGQLRGGRVRKVIDVASVADGDHDADGDAILLAPFPSNAVVTSIKVFNDDLDTGTDSLINVGIYNGNRQFTKADGTVVAAKALISEACYASAVATFQAANTSGAELAYEARNITAAHQKAFEDAGLSQDPGRDFYIGITQTAAVTTDAAGDVMVQVEYTLD